jgi:hypothetical protein
MQENQYAPAYYECMVPVPGPIYRFFVDPKTGLLNIDRVKKHCPQLLDVISYRIPTEDKYSMIPGKVVGIVPAVAGEVIIYPDDLVNISGIDFDSDKLYTMHKHFKCKRKYKTLKDLKAMMLVAYGDYKK